MCICVPTRQNLTFDINLPAFSALKLSISDTYLINGTSSKSLVFKLARRMAARNAISDCDKFEGKSAPTMVKCFKNYFLSVIETQSSDAKNKLF